MLHICLLTSVIIIFVDLINLKAECFEKIAILWFRMEVKSTKKTQRKHSLLNLKISGN